MHLKEELLNTMYFILWLDKDFQVWVARTATIHHWLFNAKSCFYIYVKYMICIHIFRYTKLEKRSKAEKLYRQFANASKEKLISLVRGNKTFNDKEFPDLIQKVCDSCCLLEVEKTSSLTSNRIDSWELV